MENVARYMGLRFPHARVLDAAGDQVPHRFARGLGQNSISRAWRDADVRVSLGKMRTNPSFLVHLTLGNLETLSQRMDDLLFADRLADASAGLMMTLDGFPCHLAVLDATHDVPDGLTGILGTSEPRHPGRIYASEDAIALDWVATRHMGLSALPRGASCQASLDWFGDVRDRTRVVGVDTPITPFTSPHGDDARIFLSALAYPVYAYLSDGGSLWMPKMESRGVPAVGRRERAAIHCAPHAAYALPLRQPRRRVGMSARVVVIGAGMGGLSCATYLARHGLEVEVLEASARAGGLAGSSRRAGCVSTAARTSCSTGPGSPGPSRRSG